MQNDNLLLNFNDNFLQETKFSVTIQGLPYLSYFSNSLTIPGVSTSSAQLSTPYSDIKLGGDKLEYDYLSFTFLLDEDLRVWEESYKWLCGVTYPHDATEYANQSKAGVYHDAIVAFNTNNNLENIRFQFKNCSPVSLSGIDMTFTGNAMNVLTSQMVLAYDNFTIERKS